MLTSSTHRRALQTRSQRTSPLACGSPWHPCRRFRGAAVAQSSSTLGALAGLDRGKGKEKGKSSTGVSRVRGEGKERDKSRVGVRVE